MHRPKKNFPKCGLAHSGKCRQSTNTCLSFGKSGHKVRDGP